jgi:hypothetical protein
MLHYKYDDVVLATIFNAPRWSASVVYANLFPHMGTSWSTYKYSKKLSFYVSKSNMSSKYSLRNIKGQNIIFYYKIGKNVAIESNFEVLLGNLRCRKLCG